MTDLRQIQTSTVTSVVIIAIHVKDLLPLDREETREDTFGETSTEYDDLPTVSGKYKQVAT